MNRQLAIFLVITFGWSWGFNALAIAGKMDLQTSRAIAGFGPGLAAFICCLCFNKPFKQLGLAIHQPSYLLAGYFLPLLYTIPVYMAVWLFGFAGFNQGFNASFPAFLFLGQLPYLLAATGQEIGWRGFLYPGLSKTNSRFMAALFTGIIWALWNYPFIISPLKQGPPLWYRLSCFTLMIVSISFIAGWLRDKSGSIWPAVLLQAAHHFYLQQLFSKLTSGPANENYLYGEYGLGLALATFVMAVLLWLKHERQTGNNQNMSTYAYR